MPREVFGIKVDLCKTLSEASLHSCEWSCFIVINQDQNETFLNHTLKSDTLPFVGLLEILRLEIVGSRIYHPRGVCG